MEIREIASLIEGLLFAYGDALSLDRMVEILDIDKKTLRLIIQKMSDEYSEQGRGILIREMDGTFQLCTRPEHYEYISRLFEPRQKHGLSQAALEVLAIIAYNEPVTRGAIEKIRGVNSDNTIIKLVEKGLIREAGKMDAPGKPMLYETTEEFLRSFGIRSLSDLPELDYEFLK